MYQVNQKRQCLCCLKDLDSSVNFYTLYHHSPICPVCIRKLKVLEQYTMFYQYPMVILYQYNDFFKELLFRYKGQFDKALYPVFLSLFMEELEKKYRGYICVVLPSSKKDNEIRGFMPMAQLLVDSKFDVFLGLYKNCDYKQTKQKDRTKIKDVLKIKDGTLLYNQKVLLFDDVITSSNTLTCALHLVEQCQPSCIEILVLAKKGA